MTTQLTLAQSNQVIITEFMASNQSTLADEDGDYSDWIEIHNSGSTEISLSGWYLTDNDDDLTKWQFPDVTLNADDYLIVFASHKDRNDSELHTNFKLSSDGEYLALIKPDGETIAWEYQPKYPPQFKDISYGLNDSLIESYFTTPTPATANGSGLVNLGPLISETSHTPTNPTTNDTITIRATVEEATSVTLHYRVMYGETVTVPMFDDGTHGDGTVQDKVYGATIPNDIYQAGDMVRYYITATDGNNQTSRWPLFTGSSNAPEYFGLVIADSAIDTQLPLLQFFVENPDWYKSDKNAQDYGCLEPDCTCSPHCEHPFLRTYTSASLFWDDQFYDNVQVRLRGGSSFWEQYPKQSLKIKFNSDHYFHYLPNRSQVKEINVNALWNDKGYIRNTLSMDLYQDVGGPASDSFMALLHQNGQFHSVVNIVEQVDETYLERHELGQNGALYKIFNQLDDASPRPELLIGQQPGDAKGVEKKTRQYEDNSDLQAMIDGISSDNSERTEFIYDNLDIPEIINYMAASVIIADWDMFSKNFYVYRDTEGTGEWAILPWDRDQSWGYPDWLDDDISVISDPLYGDYFLLFSAIYKTPALREMYLRRLRTVLDEQLQPPETAIHQLKQEARIEKLYTMMHTEVDADKEKWGNPWGQKQDFRTSLDLIKNSYLAPQRPNLYNDTLLPEPQVGGIITLISFGDTAKALVPSDDRLGISWIGAPENEPFNDTNWLSGSTGVGYERDFGYEDDIGLDVNTAMEANDSVFIRIPFQVDTSHEFDKLLFNIKYDDGFVAYLNGVKVAENNAPEQLTWNVSALSDYGDSGTETLRGFDLSEYTNLLQSGRNILAIHGLNHNNGTVGSSSDMLILPELKGEIILGSSDNSEQPKISFGTIEFNPSKDQKEEYIELINLNDIAVDISGWELRGDIEYTFRSGVVIPSGGSLFVSPNVTSFRNRATSPTGGEGHFVQGNYDSQLSSLQGTLQLYDPDDKENNRITFDLAHLVPSPYANQLIITEINYHPPEEGDTDGDKFEFIELKNISSNPLKLKDVQFIEGIKYSFPATATLNAGELLVLIRDETAFTERYPGVNYTGIYEGKLKNSGEKIILVDENGLVISSFEYDDKLPWPETPDGDGYTLVRHNQLDASNDLCNWRASTNLYGSPSVDDPTSIIEPCPMIMVKVEPNMTSTLQLTDTQGASIRIDIPVGAVSETIQLGLKRQLEITSTHAGYAWTKYAFDLNAYQNDTNNTMLSSFSFQRPLTVTINYTDANVEELEEDTLTLLYWNDAKWQKINACSSRPDSSHDETANQLKLTICHLSKFALFTKLDGIYLPVVMK
ncbi:lamin tail domain-containing protein [Anaerolineales bacterium HSG25]|nr:lamin tail domain-containing protein [Anaerolineales bacterium HSG25]